MKHLFFGASVTEQTRNHSSGEVTGYYSCLQTDYPHIVERVSAGSCSIHDAGILLLEDVITKAPDVCFLEWCTALKIEPDLDAVTYICKSLAARGIAPIPLILPRSDRDNASIKLTSDLITVCTRLGCPTLDLTGTLDDESSRLILRDVVHTTQKGAKIYAQLISDFIESDKFSIPRKDELGNWRQL